MSRYVLFSLIIIEGLIVSIITDNLAIFFFNLFFLSAGFLIIKLMMNEKRNLAYTLFAVFYLISFTYTVTTDMIFVSNPYTDYFATPDSSDFYLRSEQISENNSIYGMFSESKDRFTSYAGFITTLAILFSLSDKIDAPHSIIMKLLSVFSGAMITVLTFFMLLNIVYKKGAFASALTFGLCSPIFIQSSVILRDINIALIFTVMFYILVEHRRNVFGTILTTLLVYIAYLFRPEHGLFSLIFLFFNLYYYSSEKSFTKYIYGTFSLVLLIFLISQFEAEEQFDETTGYYNEWNQERAFSKGQEESLGLAIYRLPAIIRVPMASAFSQLMPLPVWAPAIEDSFMITQSISGFFWYFVWCFIFFGLINKKYEDYPKKYLYPLIISILLIIIASSEVAPRRVMAGYPMLFCFSAYSFYSFNKYQKTKIIIFSFFIYLFLHLTYLFIKV